MELLERRGRLRRIARAPGRRRVVVLRKRAPQAPVAASGLVEPHGVHDPVAHQHGEPAAEPVLRGPVELVQVADHAAEDLLHHVPGAEARTHPRSPDPHVAREPLVHLGLDARVVAADELLERLPVSGAGLREQVGEGLRAGLGHDGVISRHGRRQAKAARMTHATSQSDPILQPLRRPGRGAARVSGA